MDLRKIARSFLGFKANIEVIVHGNGNINNTYVVSVDEGHENKKYLLQKINNFVFKNVDELMENIQLITNYIRNNFNNVVQPEVLLTAENKPYYYHEETKSYWRMFAFVKDALGYNEITHKELFYECGFAFGLFQKMLIDFPLDELHETIPNFHNTKYRFKHFLKNIKLDKAKRVHLVQEEINFLLNKKHYANIIVDLLDEGTLPLRVTHNDTKLNNVLICKDTAKAVSVIDLDTVMPGSIVYDYGDAIRYGANTATEDEVDLSKVSLNLELFTSFTKSFLKETASILTTSEVDNLVNGVLVITFELTMRFLEDYINGDIYFKTKYEDHNLIRAKNQIALLKDMETKTKEMNEIVYKYYERYKDR